MPLKIAHISDLHFLDSHWSWSALRSKRWVALWNQKINPHRHFSQSPLDTLAQLLCDWRATHVIMTGDWVATGEREEFTRAAAFAEQLERAGLRLLTVPGNHDMYTRAAYHQRRFYEFLGRWTFPTAPVGKMSLSDDWTVIGLDTAVPRTWLSSRGRFTRAMEQELDLMCRDLTGNAFIVNHYPLFGDWRSWRQMEGRARLQALLRRHSAVRLYLHGHDHGVKIVDRRAEGYPLTVDSGSATLLPTPTCRLYELGESLEIHLAQYQEGNWGLIESQKFSS
jgi:3',5'-cyclic AMP phosphodiesterase CpdA